MLGFLLGPAMLERWAKANGFEIASSEDCWFFKGPYFWSATRGQKVYRISVRDRNGKLRSGYACCGGYLLGTLSDHVDVTWDA
ncbi:MAG: hypothetical protein HY293_16505 [Planctomycetes bacterium]|nr:hypothetical protein [Planctomycetota bacterium]